jgi:hypothetical protein
MLMDRQSDEFDREGNNVTASRLLNQHHRLVPVSGYGDNIADECAICPFAAGSLQLPGEDDEGHCTTASSDRVRAWIASQVNTS